MKSALLKVSTGLKLAFWGLVTMIAAAIILFVGIFVVAFAAGAAGPRGGGGGGGGMAGLPQGLIVLIVLFGGLYLIGFITGLVGRCMCIAVPSQVGSAKSMVTIAVVLELLSIAGNILSTADNVGNFLPIPVKLVLSIVVGLSGLVATILFILFIRSVCLYVKRRDLASRAFTVIWLGVGGVACYIIGLVVIFAAAAAGMQGGGRGGGGGPGGPAMVGVCFGGLMSLIALILLLIMVIMYMMLLYSSSAAVYSYAHNRVSRDEYEYDDRRDEDDDDDGYDRDYDRDDDYDRPRRSWDR